MGVARFLALAALVAGAVGQLDEEDSCVGHTRSCGDCIRDPSVCVWCAEKTFNGTRCQLATSVTNDWCPGEIQNPKFNPIEIDTVDFNAAIGQVTQIKPQKYVMRLRPGLTETFTFAYKPASDYPVDLYFLLDASLTMNKTKDKIEQQSTEIYNTMLNLTRNIKIGIGTFIDKNAIPFTKVLDSEMSYSFRNRLKLTNNSGQFKDVVKNTTYGNSYDTPEGGFDALSQIMTCKDEIGWRNESRKLIVLFTDARYHQAGDGIAAGIFQPYDGKCHMNDDGVYTKELEMDYPSISILNKLAADEGISIIFVVPKDAWNVYSKLQEVISGSKCILADDTEELTHLLKKIYDEATQVIKLKVNMKSEYRNDFRFTFQPDCTAEHNDYLNCYVKKGEIKTLAGEITLRRNTSYKNTTADILVEGIKEKVTLDINLIQDCECANDIPKATECHSAGKLKCGVCKCDDDRSGQTCGCKTSDPSSGNENDNSTCILAGSDLACSGHGSCICGSCYCVSRYLGRYCQFNEDNCPRHNNEVCNGHGKCVEEKCVCNEEWTGDACQCPKSERQCIGPDGEECSGRGKCQCGECVCNRTPIWDAREDQGRHCEIIPCPHCHKPQCNILEHCVRSTHAGETSSRCEGINITTVKLLHTKVDSSWKVCPDLSIDVGCYTRYMYKYYGTGIEMVVQTEKDCLESYYMYGGICLGSIILIGIATLVAWKWMTDAKDRREYEQFLREHAEDLSEPCVNTCYRPASTTIQNPAFRKRSVDYK